MLGSSSFVPRALLFRVALGVVGFAEEARAEERLSWCCPDVALAPAPLARAESTFDAFDEIVFPWRERTVPSAEPWLDGSEVLALEPYPKAPRERPLAPGTPRWFPTEPTLAEPWL